MKKPVRHESRKNRNHPFLSTHKWVLIHSRSRQCLLLVRIWRSDAVRPSLLHCFRKYCREKFYLLNKIAPSTVSPVLDRYFAKVFPVLDRYFALQKTLGKYRTQQRKRPKVFPARRRPERSRRRNTDNQRETPNPRFHYSFCLSSAFSAFSAVKL